MGSGLIMGLAAGLVVLIVSLFSKSDKRKRQELLERVANNQFSNTDLLNLISSYMKQGRNYDAIDLLEKFDFSIFNEESLAALILGITNAAYYDSFLEVGSYVKIFESYEEEYTKAVKRYLKEFDNQAKGYTYRICMMYFEETDEKDKIEEYKNKVQNTEPGFLKLDLQMIKDSRNEF